MKPALAPLRADRLKDVFIARFEELILSGALKIGQKLPSERELALQLGVSRPVVHEGLVDLAAKGLVTMTPRVGTVVNDYRTQGSLTLLNSLVNYNNGDIEPALLESMLDMRRLFEVETARLAALNRTDGQLIEMKSVLQQEEAAALGDAAAMRELDFQLHHIMAMASGNLLYPMLLNSFKQVYQNLAGTFFRDPARAPEVITFHRNLVSAIEAQDEERAVIVTKNMLKHGRDHLRAMMSLL